MSIYFFLLEIVFGFGTDAHTVDKDQVTQENTVTPMSDNPGDFFFTFGLSTSTDDTDDTTVAATTAAATGQYQLKKVRYAGFF